MLDPALAREGTTRRAAEAGIVIPRHLPLLDAVTAARPIAVAMGRLLALHVTGATAYGLDRRAAARWLAAEGLESELTERERAFVRSGNGEPQAFRFGVEAAWALAWACGLVPALDMLRACDPRFASMMPDLRREQPAAAWRARAAALPLDRLFQACDLSYALHWAFVQARLDGRRPPAALDEAAVVERRRALTWLLGDGAWDEVALDT